MLATHSISSPWRASTRYTSWWMRVSSSRQASALACAPVTSSTCDSLKSVVMFGCVSGEPSSLGCGVSASLPSGSVRRLSFSTPRSMPARRSAVIVFNRCSREPM